MSQSSAHWRGLGRTAAADCRLAGRGLGIVPAIRAALWLAVLAILPAFAEDGPPSLGRIEEVVVYGQRTPTTVSDTAIAITAMDRAFLQDMGLQGPNELLNFIPAATRTDWDIKIRGVGRNFRGLGGDPGVGTYYNGFYSPDFGIAATEGGLYDVERVEVLRGPQGTLYGRNSVGGVINYVTSQPNREGLEANVRAILGKFATNEWYAMLSGPLTDGLAYRLTGSKRIRGPAVQGWAGSEDLENLNDQNFAAILEWSFGGNFKANLRVNDRRAYSRRNFANGGHGIAGEGPCVGAGRIESDADCDPRYRRPRDTRHYAPGFRAVHQDWVDKYGDLADNPWGAVAWTHPVTGQTYYGAYNRPGVDGESVGWPYMPSQNYRQASVASYDIGSADEPHIVGLTTGDNREAFDHRQAALTLDWSLGESLSVKYLGTFQTFDYWFNRDNSFSDGWVSDIDDTALERADNWSHELRLFWRLGSCFTATSGAYLFLESRTQWYGIRERAGQGRATNAAIYGPEGFESWVLDAIGLVNWIIPECIAADRGSGAGGDLPFNDASRDHGQYCGDPGVPYSRDFQTGDTGALYEHLNAVETESLAFYSQGDLQLTDRLSLTLGVRYSEDRRDAKEQRGGYTEIRVHDRSWLPFVLRVACDRGGDRCPVEDLAAFGGPGVTPLAALNVALGAATFTGDPDFPIEPVCDLTAKECTRPLRLRGIPIGWGQRTTGAYRQPGNLTWRVNFNWEPNPDTLIYFGATSGYRAGGFNLGRADGRTAIDTNGDGQPDVRVLEQFDDERLIAYEVGYKGAHLDGRLRLNLAAYYYDYENYQTNVSTWESESGAFSFSDLSMPDGGQLGAPAGRGAVDITANIPKAHNLGFELDGTYLATDNLSVGGTYSFTESVFDAAYTFFNDNDPRYPRDILGGDLDQDPCTLPTEISALYCVEAKGMDLPGVPKHKATLWAAYAWRLTGGTLTLHGALAYTGGYATGPLQRPWDLVPPRERLDLRLTWRESTGRWSLSGFVDNVLDKTYIRHSDMNDRRTGYGANWPQRVIALHPRFWGIEFSYSVGVFR